MKDAVFLCAVLLLKRGPIMDMFAGYRFMKNAIILQYIA